MIIPERQKIQARMRAISWEIGQANGDLEKHMADSLLRRLVEIESHVEEIRRLVAKPHVGAKINVFREDS